MFIGRGRAQGNLRYLFPTIKENTMDKTLKEISDSIIANYDFDKYSPLCDDDGNVDGCLCTWCGSFAPLGVPIKHKEDCTDPREEEESCTDTLQS